jgi:hypothetical protein
MARRWGKDVFRRNELSYLLQTKELTFSRAKNELVFECKRTQNEPQIGAKKPPFPGHRSRIRELKNAPGWAPGGYMSFPRLRRCEQINYCHPEPFACHSARSEESPQFFVSGCSKSNCGDPSLRSG